MINQIAVDKNNSIDINKPFFAIRFAIMHATEKLEIIEMDESLF